MFELLFPPPHSSQPSMTRVVQSNGKWISIQQWRIEEQARALAAAAELQRQQRMPQTAHEDYDFSQRIPGGKETYDYTFKAPVSDRLSWDFTQ